jgi:hypothetical protein
MTNDTTKGGEMMKVVVVHDKESSCYWVKIAASESFICSLESIGYATNADKKKWPQFFHTITLNKDEARIYAKQRAEFYNTRLTK